ncbi:hypothetical protein KC19_3G003000 [Ceratodon purpureus]|uniref:Uncharacterized protein n=1 Tax=Ceratodon purpureus TaxID=3225 RepID=A0A8T0IFW3_CERPU|nr:hypothetical protein KC19_3G003000 [Ceratodon purpureus]
MKFTLVHFICRTTRCFRQLQYPLRSDCHYFVEPKREKGYLEPMLYTMEIGIY